MTTIRGSGRTRGLALFGLAVAALAVSACAPPPTPPDPVTPWLERGCIDSSIDEGDLVPPDWEFNGVANELNNAVSFAVGDVFSSDGTCTGEEAEPGTIVRANDQAGAIAICDDLGVPVANPPRLIDFGYDVPIDAWACVEGP